MGHVTSNSGNLRHVRSADGKLVNLSGGVLNGGSGPGSGGGISGISPTGISNTSLLDLSAEIEPISPFLMLTGRGPGALLTGDRGTNASLNLSDPNFSMSNFDPNSGNRAAPSPGLVAAASGKGPGTNMGGVGTGNLGYNSVAGRGGSLGGGPGTGSYPNSGPGSKQSLGGPGYSNTSANNYATGPGPGTGQGPGPNLGPGSDSVPSAHNQNAGSGTGQGYGPGLGGPGHAGSVPNPFDNSSNLDLDLSLTTGKAPSMSTPPIASPASLNNNIGAGGGPGGAGAGTGTTGAGAGPNQSLVDLIEQHSGPTCQGDINQIHRTHSQSASKDAWYSNDPLQNTPQLVPSQLKFDDIAEEGLSGTPNFNHQNQRFSQGSGSGSGGVNVNANIKSSRNSAANRGPGSGSGSKDHIRSSLRNSNHSGIQGQSYSSGNLSLASGPGGPGGTSGIPGSGSVPGNLNTTGSTSFTKSPSGRSVQKVIGTKGTVGSDSMHLVSVSQGGSSGSLPNLQVGGSTGSTAKVGPSGSVPVGQLNRAGGGGGTGHRASNTNSLNLSATGPVGGSPSGTHALINGNHNIKEGHESRSGGKQNNNFAGSGRSSVLKKSRSGPGGDSSKPMGPGSGPGHGPGGPLNKDQNTIVSVPEGLFNLVNNNNKESRRRSADSMSLTDSGPGTPRSLGSPRFFDDFNSTSPNSNLNLKDIRLGVGGALKFSPDTPGGPIDIVIEKPGVGPISSMLRSSDHDWTQQGTEENVIDQNCGDRSNNNSLVIGGPSLKDNSLNLYDGSTSPPDADQNLDKNLDYDRFGTAANSMNFGGPECSEILRFKTCVEGVEEGLGDTEYRGEDINFNTVVQEDRSVSLTGGDILMASAERGASHSVGILGGPGDARLTTQDEILGNLGTDSPPPVTGIEQLTPANCNLPPSNRGTASRGPGTNRTPSQHGGTARSIGGYSNSQPGDSDQGSPPAAGSKDAFGNFGPSYAGSIGGGSNFSGPGGGGGYQLDGSEDIGEDDPATQLVNALLDLNSQATDGNLLDSKMNLNSIAMSDQKNLFSAAKMAQFFKTQIHPDVLSGLAKSTTEAVRNRSPSPWGRAGSRERTGPGSGASADPEAFLASLVGPSPNLVNANSISSRGRSLSNSKNNSQGPGSGPGGPGQASNMLNIDGLGRDKNALTDDGEEGSVISPLDRAKGEVLVDLVPATPPPPRVLGGIKGQGKQLLGPTGMPIEGAQADLAAVVADQAAKKAKKSLLTTTKAENFSVTEADMKPGIEITSTVTISTDTTSKADEKPSDSGSGTTSKGESGKSASKGPATGKKGPPVPGSEKGSSAPAVPGGKGGKGPPIPGSSGGKGPGLGPGPGKGPSVPGSSKGAAPPAPPAKGGPPVPDAAGKKGAPVPKTGKKGEEGKGGKKGKGKATKKPIFFRKEKQEVLGALRPVFWNALRLDETEEGTIWNRIDEFRPDLNAEVLKYCFAEEKKKNKAKAKLGDGGKYRLLKPVTKKIEVFDQKKSYNLGIMKAKLPGKSAAHQGSDTEQINFLLQCFRRFEGLDVNILGLMIEHFPPKCDIDTITQKIELEQMRLDAENKQLAKTFVADYLKRMIVSIEEGIVAKWKKKMSPKGTPTNRNSSKHRHSPGNSPKNSPKSSRSLLHKSRSKSKSPKSKSKDSLNNSDMTNSIESSLTDKASLHPPDHPFSFELVEKIQARRAAFDAREEIRQSREIDKIVKQAQRENAAKEGGGSGCVGGDLEDDEDEIILTEEEEADVPLKLELVLHPEVADMEKFCVGINQGVPRFRLRLKLWTLLIDYEEQRNECEQNLRFVQQACSFVRNNPVLFHLFSLIVNSGNLLNAGNVDRERADGFTLDILTSIKQVKAVKNEYSAKRAGFKEKGHEMGKHNKRGSLSVTDGIRIWIWILIEL